MNYDIVQRLNDRVVTSAIEDKLSVYNREHTAGLLREAAEEITRLRAELHTKLAKFAAAAAAAENFRKDVG